MANTYENLTTEDAKYSTKNTEEHRKIDIEETNHLTQKIIGIAMKVHTVLGPGLLESAYKECLAYELINSGLYIQKELPFH